MPIEKEPTTRAAELDFGINTERVVTLTAQYRKTGFSWPNSLGQALGYQVFEQLGDNPEQKKMLAYCYYTNFLDKIAEAELIIRDGPEPGSDFIFAWTNDVEKQVEYLMKDRDEQLTAASALTIDPTGIKLLEFRLQNLTMMPRPLDPIIVEGVNSLISGTRTFRDIPWENIDLSKADNTQAFSCMRAFDDYRRFMEYMKDKLSLLDLVIEEGPES